MRRAVLSLLAGLLTFASMASAVPPPPPPDDLDPPPPPSAITTVYTDFAAAQRLPTWSQYAAQAKLVTTSADSDKFIENVAGLDPSGQYYCTGQARSLATTPEKVVLFDPATASMWVGGLLQGRGYTGGAGELQEFPIRKRAPYTIWIDTLGAGVQEVVRKPDPGAVQEALGRLVQRAIKNNVNFGAGKIFYSSVNTYDARQALMSLGISGRYGNVSAAAQLTRSKTATDKTLTIAFTQTLFTVNMVRPATADGFFDKLTTADLTAQARAGNIGKNNLPVYIKSVSYGRILLVSMHSTLSTEDLTTAAALVNRGIDAKVATAYTDTEKTLLSKVKFDVAAVGGPAAGVTSLILSGNQASYFNTPVTANTYKPISFNVHDLASDQLVKMTEVHSYNAQECAPEGGMRAIYSTGASVEFNCRAGGYLEGILGRGINAQPGRVEFKAGERISTGEYGVGVMPNGEHIFLIWWSKDGKPWFEDGWRVSVRQDTWQVSCTGPGRPPEVQTQHVAELAVPGWKQSFRCQNGGRLEGDDSIVGPRKSVEFAASEKIVVQDIVDRTKIVKGRPDPHKMVRFSVNGQPWPDAGFELWNSTWRFTCNP